MSTTDCWTAGLLPPNTTPFVEDRSSSSSPRSRRSRRTPSSPSPSDSCSDQMDNGRLSTPARKQGILSLFDVIVVIVDDIVVVAAAAVAAGVGVICCR